jgi:DNA-binding response OmpR family regulator
MERPSFMGRSLLIVEDEPLIVMDISLAFEHTGAQLTTTNTLRHALIIVEHDGISGAILDHALPDGDSSLLYKRLKERDIPFIIYSGYRKADFDDPLRDVPYLAKPANPAILVEMMLGLIRSSEIQAEN